MKRGWSHGRDWQPGEVEREVFGYAQRYGRMPTTPELRADGRNDLAAQITRAPGGMRGLAERLGLSLSGSETHRGQAIERRVADELRALRFAVRPQTAKAPFDLLVDGVRVDVKSAKWTDNLNRNTGGRVRAFVFALNKIPPTCDLYIAVCVDEKNETIARYFIPASAAHVRTLSITPRGKWSRYREAIGELSALVETKRSK